MQIASKIFKEERNFELSLPTLVRGTNASGSRFEESTELISISSQVASFWLKSKVKIGSKLNATLNIPKTLILENHLNLSISGKVIFIKAETSKKKQLISVRLDKTFKIRPLSI